MNCFIVEKDKNFDCGPYPNSVVVSCEDISDDLHQNRCVGSCNYPIKADVVAARAYTVFEYLKENSYECIFFVDCSHLAFYCLQAKKSKLSFLENRFIEISKSTLNDEVSTEKSFLQNKAKQGFDLILSFEELGQKYSQISVEKTNLDQKPTERISVCISHKNRWELLIQALTSLQAQTYKNFEVILVDDCSDDASQYSQFQDNADKKFSFKIELHRNASSMGPGYSRNWAAQLSTSKYIMFMDDDNIAKPEELETFIIAAEANSADVVSCSFDNFRESTLDGIQLIEFGQRNIFLGGDLETAKKYNCLGDSNSFFKRESFLKIKGFFEDASLPNEDWELLLRMTQQGFKIITIPNSLFYYRWHSFQRSWSTSMLGGINKIRKCLDLPEIFAEPEGFKMIEFGDGIIKPFS